MVWTRRMGLMLLCIGALVWAAPGWTQAAHPFGVPEVTSGVTGTGWWAALFGQVSVWQTHFYRLLAGAVRHWQAPQGQAWTLIGLSFAYGVLHALGPGHGKAVMSTYVLANRQTARNGALLALAASMLQALVAIAMVAVLAIVFSATAGKMNEATRWLELVSSGLIALLGLWLVWSKMLRPIWRGKAQAPDHLHTVQVAKGQARHQHAHHHDCGCAHAHVPSPQLVEGPLVWRRAWAAILAVGLRPCSGALIVLVFSLSQGVFVAGIAAALAMGLGTGLTVAALACLAVAAGTAVTRLGARISTQWAARMRYAIECLGAWAVLLLGVLLLGGQAAGSA